MVRYQAALRPDRMLLIHSESGPNDTCLIWPSASLKEILASQNLENLFKFNAQLLDDLLTLADIRFRLIAHQTLARTTDGETFVIQQATNLTDDQTS